MLTLTHTHEGGTILEGTTRGDGSAQVLRTRPGGSYWKWSRNVGDGGAWFIVRSRDHLPHHERIRATAEALRAAGFEVTVSVDETSRARAEIVEDQRERAGERAERLTGRAERHASAAQGHWDAEHAILDRIPPGQPILVGHHSERGHRRALERAHRHMEHAVEHHQAAKDAARRAEIAERAASGKEPRSTVANRVKTAAADVARDLRALHGHWRRWGESQSVEFDETTRRYVLRFLPVDPDSPHGQAIAARIIENTDKRLYWSQVLEQMPAPAKPVKPGRGDTVMTDFGGPFTVKSCTKDLWVTFYCPTEDDPKRTQRLPWCRVHGWTRAADIAAGADIPTVG